MCAAGLVGSIRPAIVAEVASRVIAHKPWRAIAVVARLAIGAILILVSDQTLYPLLLKIIGALAIMGGTVVALLGGSTLDRWAKSITGNTVLIRVLCLISLVIGMFLIHATL